MSREQWSRVRELFERALGQDPTDAAAWVKREANGDSSVIAEVLSLLRHHAEAGAFLAEPATGCIELLREEPPLIPGQVVGSYTIVREAGRGGMGRVYVATDARLGRTVALKALRPQAGNEAELRARLRREAQAAAALAHPGICTVYALEEFDGELFIASEFVDGGTLREEIQSGRTPAGHDVLQTAREIAAALACAHEAGITHRDLKPENVMRAKDGRLKILDFGLARVDRGLPASGGSPVRDTRPDMLMGTPGYVAPEQLNGQPADPRSDVFAFGVLMYEYACGTHPFGAATQLGVAARVLEGEPPAIHGLRPDLPSSLVSVIERCLQKSPGARFSSAAEIVREIERDVARPRAKAATWWRAHQVILVALYFVASGVAWRIKESNGGVTAAVFLTIGIAASVAGVFRAHLLFTERVNSAGLAEERRRAAPVTLAVDLLITVALACDGAILARAAPLAAVLTIALGIGLLLARLVLEPSTTTAAFGDK